MDKCRWDGKIKLSNKMKKIILWSCTVTNSAAQLTRTGKRLCFSEYQESLIYLFLQNTVVCIYDFKIFRKLCENAFAPICPA